MLVTRALSMTVMAALEHEEPFRGVRITDGTLLVIIILIFPAAFLYGAWDGLRHDFTFWQFAGRFLAMLYLMKAFDIIFLDWFLLIKSRFFQHYYPETKGCAGYQQFGFNRREQFAALSCSHYRIGIGMDIHIDLRRRL